MRVLALDIATSTGVAFGDSKGTPRAWTVHLGKPPDERRFANALRMTAGIITENEPDLIVVEAAVGGPKASAFLIGLLACVRGCAFDRGVQCEVAHLRSIRKHFMGKELTLRDFPHLKPVDAKKAIKARVIQRCAQVGWPVNNDDEADALALWDYGCAHFARSYQAKPAGELFK